MIVSIHQPHYLPWLGLLEKIALSDRFVVFDTVAYNRASFQHRALYSTDAGAKYLSLSVRHKGEHGTLAAIELAKHGVPSKHFKTLEQRYGKRPGWGLVAPWLAQILCSPPARLLDINLRTLVITMRLLGVQTEVVLASQLEPLPDGWKRIVPKTDPKSHLVIATALTAGGDVYLSGLGAKTYLDTRPFRAAHMRLVWQRFIHPGYDQSHEGQFQKGCFALEWLIEDPHAPSKFAEHVARARVRLDLPPASPSRTTAVTDRDNSSPAALEAYSSTAAPVLAQKID